MQHLLLTHNEHVKSAGMLCSIEMKFGGAMVVVVGEGGGTNSNNNNNKKKANGVESTMRMTCESFSCTVFHCKHCKVLNYA